MRRIRSLSKPYGERDTALADKVRAERDTALADKIHGERDTALADKIRVKRGTALTDRFRAESLTGKMVTRLLRGLGVGLFVFVVLYFGSVNILQYDTQWSFLLYHEEEKGLEALQIYADRNHLAATDAATIRKWAEENGFAELKVYREDEILFDSKVKDRDSRGTEEGSGVWASGISQYARKYTEVVHFADGDAFVYLYSGLAEKYFHFIFGITVMLGFAACLGVFIQGMQEDVRYIQCLQREVAVISLGNLEEKVTIQGEDELAQLARGLDSMRQELKEHEQTEKELRAAQEKLVVGMSHDLRTPLTGLLTYMEILRKQEREGNVSGEYIEKAYSRILQIKSMSDRMFEFFFIDSQKETELEPPEDIRSVLGDYLSELCALLADDGFSVNADGLEWRNVRIRVNTDYMGRILNNIISNIEKYGDRERAVQIELTCGADQVEVLIANGRAMPDSYVAGTGIGVKNVSMMMEKMGGSARVGILEDTYWIELWFPICEDTTKSHRC